MANNMQVRSCVSELCRALAEVPESHKRGMDGVKKLLTVSPVHQTGRLAKEMVGIAAVYNHCHLPASLAVLQKGIDIFMPYVALSEAEFSAMGEHGAASRASC